MRWRRCGGRNSTSPASKPAAPGKAETGPLRVIAIGRATRGPEAELFERYARRIKPGLDLLALPDAAGSPAEIRRREAGALLAKISSGQFLVALDQDGIAFDSAGLAQHLADWHGGTRPLVFAIGGAEGLDRTVLNRADAILSLGPLTWPHLLVRAMLAEQIYRAQSIASRHPYHRAGRP